MVAQKNDLAIPIQNFGEHKAQSWVSHGSWAPVHNNSKWQLRPESDFADILACEKSRLLCRQVQLRVITVQLAAGQKHTACC